MPYEREIMPERTRLESSLHKTKWDHSDAIKHLRHVRSWSDPQWGWYHWSWRVFIVIFRCNCVLVLQTTAKVFFKISIWWSPWARVRHRTFMYACIWFQEPENEDWISSCKNIPSIKSYVNRRQSLKEASEGRLGFKNNYIILSQLFYGKLNPLVKFKVQQVRTGE